MDSRARFGLFGYRAGLAFALASVANLLCWSNLQIPEESRMEAKTLSAGVVVVRPSGGEMYYLLLRAFSHWDFPKGLVEQGELPLEGAEREVEEETTITQLEFKWGMRFRETGPYGPGKVARYYIAETEQDDVDLPINPEIGRPEHDEYRWVTYQDALGLVGARVRSVLDWANEIVNPRQP